MRFLFGALLCAVVVVLSCALLQDVTGLPIGRWLGYLAGTIGENILIAARPVLGPLIVLGVIAFGFWIMVVKPFRR